MTLLGAASLLLCSWLLAEQSLTHPHLRHPLQPLRALARFVLGSFFAGAFAGALMLLLVASLPVALAALIGAIVGTTAGWLLLRRASGMAGFRPMMVPAGMVLMMFAALALASQDLRSWLIGTLVIGFASAIGIPAHQALLQGLDDSDVPDRMRPLPARVIASAAVVLASAVCLT